MINMLTHVLALRSLIDLKVFIQVLTLIQHAIGQLSSLIGSISRIDFNAIINQFKPILSELINQALATMLGGRASIDIAAALNGFLEEVTKPLLGIGQHFLNQRLAAVLGGLGSLGRARAISDLFATLSQQIGNAVTVAQGVLTGALDSLVSLGSNILDASKPHWEHLHGSITDGQ
ncbi:unnamed protein product [Rotaria socialis]